MSSTRGPGVGPGLWSGRGHTRVSGSARPARAVLAALAAFTVLACVESVTTPAAPAGDPLPHLSATELARFHAGRALFDKVYTPEEGLGPLFNENQCSACHTDPASGGTTGFERIVKATRFLAPDSCDLLIDDGGENVRSRVTPLAAAQGVGAQQVPASATETGRFAPTALFGLGLVEAIPELVILARADPDDADGDGISGRAGRTHDGRLARFGRKADFATIEAFTESALQLEMGITTPSRPREGVVHRASPANHVDPAPEPEATPQVVELLSTFVRFLAAPERAEPRSTAHGDSVRAGRRLFERVGCTSCHVPSMRTGAHDVAALSEREVALYSDLLLHDMGPALSSVCGPSATPSELRTAMLMGLQHRTFYLHDSRTSDLREAILTHGGEAARAREAFARLPWIQQEILLLFLKSL